LRGAGTGFPLLVFGACPAVKPPWRVRAPDASMWPLGVRFTCLPTVPGKDAIRASSEQLDCSNHQCQDDDQYHNVFADVPVFILRPGSLEELTHIHSLARRLPRRSSWHIQIPAGDLHSCPCLAPHFGQSNFNGSRVFTVTPRYRSRQSTTRGSGSHSKQN
jgi:hypothetical protein